MMLITSTKRTAGATTKKTSAPQPSDAHGLAPQLLLHGAQLPRHERGDDQGEHQAERGLHQPADEAEAHPGFRKTPLAIQPKAPPQSTASKVSRLTDDGRSRAPA